MAQPNDARYLDLILTPIRVCARYKPKLGQGGLVGVTLSQFQALYQADPFYSWFGLDNALMYAAHKAAGGMTSIYRQVGIGCERMVRAVIQDRFNLSDAEVTWSYQIPVGTAGKTRTLSLDARIPLASVKDPADRARLQVWLLEAARQLGVDPAIAASLQGIVFEVRQGYKSADSKRQNADIANAAVAYTKGYLPCAVILSGQIDGVLLDRYRRNRWVVFDRRTAAHNPHASTYDFMRDIVGYELAAFFTRHSGTLRTEIDAVLRGLFIPLTGPHRRHVEFDEFFFGVALADGSDRHVLKA